MLTTKNVLKKSTEETTLLRDHGVCRRLKRLKEVTKWNLEQLKLLKEWLKITLDYMDKIEKAGREGGATK